MSLATWKAEFYPVPADQVSAADALAHSIRKWTGLLPENLARHGCRVHGKVITGDGGKLWMDGETCALCHRYERYVRKNGGRMVCTECPLYESRGERCDQRAADEADSPYGLFLDGDPRPMLAALQKAQAWVDAQHSAPPPEAPSAT